MDKEHLIRLLEENIPFNQFLGMKHVSIKEKEAIIKLPFKKAFIGDTRRAAIHGGIISTLLDTVGGFAAMSLLHKDDAISTIDLRIDYLLPAGEHDLFAKGKVVRLGNRVTVTSMEAYCPEIGKVFAEGKAVYNIKKRK